MKNIVSLLFLILLYIPGLSSASDRKPRIIVLNFRTTGNFSNVGNLGVEVANNIEFGFLNEKCFSVLERKENLTILKEIEFQSAFEKVLDPKTKSALLIVGAQYLVLGEVTSNKTTVKINAKIIEVSSNKIVAGDFVTISSSCNNIYKLLILTSNNLCDKLISSFKSNLEPSYICSNSENGFHFSELFEPLSNSICNKTTGDVIIGIMPVLKYINCKKLNSLQGETIHEIVGNSDSLDNYEELIPTTFYSHYLAKLNGIKLINQREMRTSISKLGYGTESYPMDTVIDKLLVFGKSLSVDFVLVPSFEITPLEIEWGNDSVINKSKFKIHLGLELLSINDRTFKELLDTTLLYTYEPANLKLKIDKIVIDRLGKYFSITIKVNGQNMYKQIEWLTVYAVYKDSSVLITDSEENKFESEEKNKICVSKSFKPDESFHVALWESFYIPFKVFKKELFNSTYKPKSGGKLEYYIFSNAAEEKFRYFKKCKKCSDTFWFLVKFGLIDRKNNRKTTLTSILSSDSYKICNTKGSIIEAQEDVW